MTCLPKVRAMKSKELKARGIKLMKRELIVGE